VPSPILNSKGSSTISPSSYNLQILYRVDPSSFPNINAMKAFDIAPGKLDSLINIRTMLLHHPSNVLIQYANITLHSTNFLTLLDNGTWVADSAINMVLIQLLMGQSKGFCFIDSILFDNIRTTPSLFLTTIKKRNLDFKCITRFLFPINTGSHWFFIGVHMQAKRIYVCDSYHSLQKNLVDFIISLLDEGFRKSNIIPDWTEWQICVPRNLLTKQLNGTDCGVHTILNGFSFGTDSPFFGSTKEIPFYRRVLASKLLDLCPIYHLFGTSVQGFRNSIALPHLVSCSHTSVDRRPSWLMDPLHCHAQKDVFQTHTSASFMASISADMLFEVVFQCFGLLPQLLPSLTSSLGSDLRKLCIKQRSSMSLSFVKNILRDRILSTSNDFRPITCFLDFFNDPCLSFFDEYHCTNCNSFSVTSYENHNYNENSVRTCSICGSNLFISKIYTPPLLLKTNSLDWVAELTVNSHSYNALAFVTKNGNDYSISIPNRENSWNHVKYSSLGVSFNTSSFGSLPDLHPGSCLDFIIYARRNVHDPFFSTRQRFNGAFTVVPIPKTNVLRSRSLKAKMDNPLEILERSRGCLADFPTEYGKGKQPIIVSTENTSFLQSSSRSSPSSSHNVMPVSSYPVNHSHPSSPEHPSSPAISEFLERFNINSTYHTPLEFASLDDVLEYSDDQLLTGVFGVPLHFPSFCTPDELDFTVDIDSVIYVSSSLDFVRKGLNMFPISNRAFTLKTSNHIYVQHGDTMVPASTIPNYCIFHSDNMFINMFFPLLRRQGQKLWVNILENHDERDWYDNVLKHVFKQILPRERLGDFPLSYDQGFENTRCINGTFKLSNGIPVSFPFVNSFIHTLNSVLQSNSRAREKFGNYFFIATLKNLKGTINTNVSEDLFALLRSSVNIINWSAINYTNLYFDPGWQFFLTSAPSPTTLAWRRSSLLQLWHNLGFKAPTVDYLSGLYHLAGCHSEGTKQLKDVWGVVFGQVYHGDMKILQSFDRTVRYNESGIRRFSFNDARKGNTSFVQCTDTMESGWELAKTESWSLRFELRCKYSAFKVQDLVSIGKKIKDLAPLLITRVSSHSLNSFRIRLLTVYKNCLNLGSSMGSSPALVHACNLMAYFIKNLSATPYRDPTVISAETFYDVQNRWRENGWQTIRFSANVMSEEVRLALQENKEQMLIRELIRLETKAYHLGGNPFSGTLPNSKTLSDWANQIYFDFVTDLWNRVPNKSSHMVNPDVSPSSFNMESIQKHLHRPFFVRIKMTLPEWKNILWGYLTHNNSKGGWQHLKSPFTLIEAYGAISEEDKDLLNQKLERRLLMIDVLPNSTKDIFWPSKSQKVHNGETALLMRSLHPVTELGKPK
jgi:hypothetical protein